MLAGGVSVCPALTVSSSDLNLDRFRSPLRLNRPTREEEPLGIRSV